ncbi:hypothetical protein D3C80_1647370 [compost metagenome]
MPHDTQRLVKMVGNGFTVHLADSPFLSANTGGEITEMVDSQRYVSARGFADRFAVIPGFCRRQQLQVLLHPIGNFQQNGGSVLNRGMCPFLFRFMCRIQRQIDVFFA